MANDRIKFYSSRMKSMSFPELFYRAKWKFKLETYYKLLSFRKNKECRLNFEQLRKDFSQPHFYFEQENISSSLKNTLKPNLKKADSYLNHDIPIYEINKNLGAEINWNKDYKHETIWPAEFIGKIHHAETKYGDVRYIWELNRCAHLVELGKAYYSTNNEKYAQEVINQIESWSEKNPYLKTVNWFSGLELGVRIINWLIALKLIKNSPAFSKEKLNKIISSLYLQTNFIYHNLSKYSSANNHLIGELAAVKIFSTIFPSLPKAEEWKKNSSKLLNEELLKQIYPDGIGKEQSINYLIFDLELYYLSSVALYEEIKPEIKERIAKSQDFLSNLLINEKEFPTIGDSDDAYFNLSLFSSLFPKNILSKSKLFPQGGYFISKNKEKANLIFDCGPLGYLSTSGHGHSDALSFILAVDNKLFFTDLGTYVYHGDLPWRNYFKSTEAHNTIEIDGKNQSEITGTFIYGKKANTKIIETKINDNEDEITASHDGYENLGIIHQREIIHNKKKKEITIIDNIICNENNGKEYPISIFFNLHPKVKLVKLTENNYNLINDITKIKLTLDPTLSIQEHCGEINPILGWYSPQFGVKVPAVCLEGKAKIKETTVFKTVINY